MQNIYIKNLGPIKEIHMDINRINLLIGEQATGKSTIAKGIYFFRLIKTNVIDYLCQLSDGISISNINNVNKDVRCVKVLKGQFKDIFVRLFGKSWDLKDDMYLKYHFSDDIWIDVALKNGQKKYLSVRFSKKLNYAIRELEGQVRKISEASAKTITSIAFATAERIRNHEIIKKSVNEIFNDEEETYYIPAGRSLLTTMANSKSLIMTAGKNMDLITEQFMQIIDNIRGYFKEGLSSAHKYYPDGKRKYNMQYLIAEIIEMLHGEYFFENGEEYLLIDDKTNNNGKIEINFASSGQQEILWLINYLYVLILRKEKAFVIIEEPEAHIYPSLQKKIVELIIMFANLNESKVLLTTHSPYVLNAVNNAYYAGVLCQEKQQIESEIEKIIGRYKMIHYGALSAYKIQHENNAQLENLFDDEAREICSYKIDEISQEFNETYTKLYNIELDYANED
ncbi:MAG: AAA family ATPase [Eubacteriales bacterium]|nr:AAA family ATPase [Eubacteriales bacterium]